MFSHFSRILFRTLNHQYDYTFDWTMLKQRGILKGGTNALPHAAGEGGAREERRDKDKQPTETEK